MASATDETDQEESLSFELGDRILLLGGRYDKLRGRIYYIDTDTLIRILPDGVSDRLVDLPILDGDFDPELGVDTLYSLEKRVKPAFVTQIDAHAGQIAETFSANGEPGPSYTIQAVDETTDTLLLRDETGAELEVECNFTGIPQDIPFAVLRPRQPPEAVTDVNAELAAEATEAANAEEEELEGEFSDFMDEEIAAAPAAAITGFLIREIPASERFYSDSVQRSDLLQNFLEALPAASQKNPQTQKRIRALVEQCMILRNALVRYTRTGEPIGTQATSFLTLADALERITPPLARPVIQAKKVLYLDHGAEAIAELFHGNPHTDPRELPGKHLEIKYLQDSVKDANDFIMNADATNGMPTGPDSLPNFFLTQESFNRQFNTPWVSAATDGEPTPFHQDTDVLRAPAPTDMSLPSVDSLMARVGPAKETIVTTEWVGTTLLGLERALAPRSTRIQSKEPPRRVESGDEAATINTLLFPLSEQRNLGARRSGVLAKDIALNQQFPQSLAEILERLEGIPDVATAGGILSIGMDGNTQGAIPLEEWLRAQPLYPQGLADVWTELANYGMEQTELTVDQVAVLVEHMDMYRALVKQYILELRDAAKRALSQLKLLQNPFLTGEALQDILTTLSSERILMDRLEEMRRSTPAYKENDIALFAALLSTHGDLVLTTLAQIPGPLAKERTRKVRDQFMGALREALARAEKGLLAGEAPTPNPCEHVMASRVLGKIKDDSQRMQAFARFLAKYRGEREENWVNCVLCDQHLVCYHEVLQLQEFLRPREKDTLHKELLLAFSGGQFHGKFICKNCGQPLSELEFDQSLEFTDEGVPISGRAVLTNLEGAEAEQLEDLLGPAAGTFEEITFKTEGQTTIYKAARRLFDILGLHAQIDSYRRIVRRVDAELLKLPSREDYALAAKGKRAVMDYDLLYNRILVGALAANVLIEVQTHVPGYILRYRIPGCRAGFSGFPTGNEKDRTGLNYVVCAISLIRDTAAPWNMTGFQREANDTKRQEAIRGYTEKLLTPLMTNASVQQQITAKREYLERVYGSVTLSEQIPEFIPSGFLPVPFKLEEDAAKTNAIVPAAATPQEAVRAWILQAHRIAKESGTYLRGAMTPEAQCCQASIEEAGAFWREKAATMAALPLKTPPLGPVRAHVGIHFKPRPLERLEAKITPDIMYKLFLKVCYDGPHMGLPHETGYTNECQHCGFVFPENPYTPRPFPPLSSDAKTQKEMMKTYLEEVSAIVTKGKVALETQRVAVTERTFEQLVDITHKKHRVDLPVPQKPLLKTDLLKYMMRMEPEPFGGWREQIRDVIERLERLPPDAEDLEYAEAYGPISNSSVELLAEMQARLGEGNIASLKAILESEPTAAAESLWTYILVPFQRLTTNLMPKVTTMSVQDSYTLSVQTRQDIKAILDFHRQHITQLAPRVKGLTRAKMVWATARLAHALKFVKQKVRAYLLPGGTIGMPYLITALFGGILAEFINPNVAPPGTGEDATGMDTGARAPFQILDVLLQKMRAEGLNYTQEQIRQIIDDRQRRENSIFIRKNDTMTPEEKQLDKMKQKLGLGDWAVGGTKAVYMYDEAMYERERKQREEMGLGQLFDEGAGALLYGEGAGANQEDGYDNTQIGEDDY